MIELLTILTFCWLTFWASVAIVQLSRGNLNSIYYVLLVFYGICGVPLLFDLSFGIADYERYLGLHISSNDKTTSIIYCIYVSIIPIIWWYTAKYKLPVASLNKETRIKREVLLDSIKPILVMLLLSPIFVALFSPHAEFYLSYGAIVTKASTNPDFFAYYKYVGYSSSLSIIAAGTLLLLRKDIYLVNYVQIVPWIVIAVWLNGKRFSVILTFVFIGYVLLNKRMLKGWSLVYVGVIAAIVFSQFSSMYQTQLRSNLVKVGNPEYILEGKRLDYFRDETIKMTIYAELHPKEFTILNFRGESLLFDALFFVPRKFWADKPWPYAVNFTSAVYGYKPVRFLGWNFTTSWLEEAIANFSWLGMLIGPLTISWICRVGDKHKNNGFLNILTIMIACLLLFVQFAAYAPLYVIWFALMIRERILLKKIKLA